MKQLFRNNAIFLSLSLLLALSIGLALLWIPKGELHLLLCTRHTPARDTFYKYYTQVAEWLPYLVCLSLLFYRAWAAALATAGVVLSGLFTQIIKYIVDAPRPLTWFAENYPEIQLPLVEGVRMSKYYSFPSGHTTTFFALFLALSIIVTKKLSEANRPSSIFHCPTFPAPEPRRSIVHCQLSIALQILFAFLATLGAYSRIYLSQHFATDVLGGILIGITITLLSYAVLSRFQDKKWYNYHFFAKKCT
ncbi:MAG: phosphatase PAP2 family protein [Paludibacteraceae bacterium]|nr:phosphatase PAP2 family protein [Paludibacteraceae bacterium]